jgi:membrane-associated phospholipid phosphatase
MKAGTSIRLARTRRSFATRLCVVLAAVVSVTPMRAAAVGTADEKPAAVAGAEDAAPVATLAPDGRRTLRRLPANLGRGVIGVFHRDNLVPLLAGGAATGIASIWDQEVREAAQPYDWGESLETAGGPIWSSVFVVGMFTAGRISHGTRFRAMTYDMLDAAVVNFGYTELLKLAVGRERPNGQDDKSFPSGHTSNSFALAAVVERHYGWKLGVPAYLVAGLVGASRIQQDKHYLSDVVAGAALGYVVGRTVVRVNSRPLEGAAHAASLDVAPILGRKTRGVRVALRF